MHKQLVPINTVLYQKVVVYSQRHCQPCVAAKDMLTYRGIEFEERILGEGWTKEQLLADAPAARSVPQVIIDGAVIGGPEKLKEYFRALENLPV